MDLVESTDKVQVKQKCCYNWTKLLLSASLPIILGVFTLVYTLQQDKLARVTREQDLNISGANREQDLSIAQENAKRDISEREKIRKQTIYDSYIAEISKTIRNRDFNVSDVNQIMHIRFQTLNALRQLDLHQKREVIVFLYEIGLIRANSPKPVNLRGADLTGVEFVRSASFLCELNNLYLAEVLADNIVFERCQFERSVFNGASLNGAKFLHSDAIYTSYEAAYMMRVVFNATNTHSSNFARTDLRNASFVDNSVTQANFTNTDLSGSSLSKNELNANQNIYINTRFPNGSFSAIDTKQLVVDGGAEINCPNGRSNHWIDKITGSTIYIVNKSYYNGSIRYVEGNCFFRLVTTSEYRQVVNVQQYSVFIDSGQAWYNLSAYLMCRSAKPDDQAYVTVKFLTQDSFYTANLSPWIKSIKGQTSFPNIWWESRVPAKTHYIHVFIGATMTPSIPVGNQTNECYIDRVQFYIFKRLNVSSTELIVTTENPKP